jgi:divalent metal cation (Fe/Co/Zn/Cd) transporter
VAVAVMLFSIGVDFWRSRALKIVADKYDSQALKADALHFRTDIWSSAVVILGLFLVWLGRLRNVNWLFKADPIAALFVAVIVVHVSWRLARQTIDALLDGAPHGIRTRILDSVANLPGVLEVDRVRIRSAGSRYFVDLTIGLGRNVTFQASEQVAHRVTDTVRQTLPGADVVVNTVSRAGRWENIFDRIRAAALRNNLTVHDISVQDLDGKQHVELHVELDEKLTLMAAHERVTALESDIRSSEPATVETSNEIVRDMRLEARLKAIGGQFPEVVDVHEILLKRVREHLFLSCHVTMHDKLPLSRVHEVQTALEIRFKTAAPQLFRVLIHPEPQTDNRR